MLTAIARVPTEHPGRYLAQLCRHAQQVGRLRHRPPSHGAGDTQPPPEVKHVERSDTRGIIDFGWGRCTMQADGNMLTLRAEAADEQNLQLTQDIVTRDIERFGRRDHLNVTWQRSGAPAPPTDPVGQGRP